MDCASYRTLVAADVDGQLDTHEASAAKAHVSSCPACAALRWEQDSVRVLLRNRVLQHQTPAAVRRRIIAALDAEERTTPTPIPVRRWLIGNRHRVALVGAVAALLALVILPVVRSPGPDLLTVLDADVQAADAQELPLAVRTNDVEELRRYYHNTGHIDFEKPLEDLSGFGFHPIGGTLGTVGKVDTTLTVYEGPQGKLVCRRFRAGALPLPKGGDHIGNAEFFTAHGTTVRIQRDGDTICCLASAMPRDAFLRALGEHTHP